MLNSDIKLPSYMSDGPAYPGETVHAAMGENTAYALTSHMFGHGLEHEPVDQAERDTEHTAQEAARTRRARTTPGPTPSTTPLLEPACVGLCAASGHSHGLLALTAYQPAVVGGSTMISLLSPWKVQARAVPALLFLVGLIVMVLPTLPVVALALMLPAAWIRGSWASSCTATSRSTSPLPSRRPGAPLRRPVSA